MYSESAGDATAAPKLSDEVGSFEKGDRGARILKIQTILQGNPRGLTTGEIARRTGVNPRTTYRDVKALEAMNVPVYEEAGRIAIDPNYFIAPVKFTLREAMALLMGVRLMSRHSDEGWRRGRRTLSIPGCSRPWPSAGLVARWCVSGTQARITPSSHG
ncbi:MAG: HTH domain-containing protein [Chloroflexota bacterium]|nr:MAG: HTH domain-containing protein [Chloroflexota bacterium]